MESTCVPTSLQQRMLSAFHDQNASQAVLIVNLPEHMVIPYDTDFHRTVAWEIGKLEKGEMAFAPETYSSRNLTVETLMLE